MEEVMEQYGTGLLQMLGGLGVMALFWNMLQPGGAVQMLVQQYMNGICG